MATKDEIKIIEPLVVHYSTKNNNEHVVSLKSFESAQKNVTVWQAQDKLDRKIKAEAKKQETELHYILSTFNAQEKELNNSKLMLHRKALLALSREVVYHDTSMKAIDLLAIMGATNSKQLEHIMELEQALINEGADGLLKIAFKNVQFDTANKPVNMYIIRNEARMLLADFSIEAGIPIRILTMACKILGKKIDNVRATNYELGEDRAIKSYLYDYYYSSKDPVKRSFPVGKNYAILSEQVKSLIEKYKKKDKYIRDPQLKLEDWISLNSLKSAHEELLKSQENDTKQDDTKQIVDTNIRNAAAVLANRGQERAQQPMIGQEVNLSETTTDDLLADSSSSLQELYTEAKQTLWYKDGQTVYDFIKVLLHEYRVFGAYDLKADNIRTCLDTTKDCMDLIKLEAERMPKVYNLYIETVTMNSSGERKAVRRRPIEFAARMGLRASVVYDCILEMLGQKPRTGTFTENDYLMIDTIVKNEYGGVKVLNAITIIYAYFAKYVQRAKELPRHSNRYIYSNLIIRLLDRAEKKVSTSDIKYKHRLSNIADWSVVCNNKN